MASLLNLRGKVGSNHETTVGDLASPLPGLVLPSMVWHTVAMVGEQVSSMHMQCCTVLLMHTRVHSICKFTKVTCGAVLLDSAVARFLDS
jgi:hypothetical protein